jgi:hypothetical protein
MIIDWCVYFYTYDERKNNMYICYRLRPCVYSVNWKGNYVGYKMFLNDW